MLTEITYRRSQDYASSRGWGGMVVVCVMVTPVSWFVPWSPAEFACPAGPRLAGHRSLWATSAAWVTGESCFAGSSCAILCVPFYGEQGLCGQPAPGNCGLLRAEQTAFFLSYLGPNSPLALCPTWPRFLRAPAAPFLTLPGLLGLLAQGVDDRGQGGGGGLPDGLLIR